MKKKAGALIILCSFMVICFSWILWIVFGRFTDRENHEKRLLAEPPKFTIENYESYAGDWNAYIDDNMPFRNELVKTYSYIDYYVFKRSIESKVIIGKNGWLFYINNDDGNSRDDYLGENLFSDEDLKKIAENCMAFQETLEKQGREFVLFIAPNKERIYSEYMPDKYGEPATMYRTLQVVQYLRKNTDIKVVYPYEELMQAKEKLSEDLYYKTDTHWNQIGGYIGTCALLKELGINMPIMNSSGITIHITKQHIGDMLNMCNLIDVYIGNDLEYDVAYDGKNNYKKIRDSFSKTIEYSNITNEGLSLYVIRDSFASWMGEYFGGIFNDTCMRHRKTYTYKDISDENPDIVVYETVERQIGELISFDFYK